MRNQLVFVGILCAGLSFGMWSASGQETKLNEAPVALTGDTKINEAPSLPPIPYRVIAGLPGNKAESEKLGLTQQQRNDIAAFAAALNAETNHLNLVSGVLVQARLNSYRVQLAVMELNDEVTAKAQIKAQDFLTAVQRAKWRQTHRKQIQQMASEPQTRPSQLATLDTLLTNNDFLSLLEIPEIQESLSITDEQWLRIEAVKKSAYPAARELIQQLANSNLIDAAVAVPAVNMRLLDEQSRLESMKFLSEGQRKQFQELLNDAENLVAIPMPTKEARMRLFLLKSHAMLSSMQSRATGAESSYEVKLHNAFADPDTIAKLNLTEPQQAEIIQHLKDCEQLVARKMQERHRANYESGGSRQDQLHEVVVAHNTEYQKPLADVLTTEQQAQLKKECWKRLGWHALLKPDVAEQLQLTDEQKTEITEALKTPAPISAFFATPFGKLGGFNQPTDLEAFKKQHEETQRKMSEFHTAVTKRVWDCLSPEQREKVASLTGLTSLKN